MKQRGSALIISMMMIATVGAAAFGIAKLLYADTTIASTYENGAIAYYAAESGIEEGFLRYKYNMNAEVPFGSTTDSTKFWKLGDNRVFRTNINREYTYINSGSIGIDPDYALDYDFPTGHWTGAAREQIYDLRMGYLGTFGKPFLGQDTNGDGQLMLGGFAGPKNYATGDYSILNIAKDKSFKIDLSGIDLGRDLHFGLRYSGSSDTFSTTLTGTQSKCKALAEIKFVINSSGIIREYKGLLGYSLTTTERNFCGTYLGIDPTKILMANKNNVPVDASPDNNKYMAVEVDQLQRIITENGGALPSTTAKISLSVKPLYYDSAIALTIKDCDSDMNNCTNKTNVVPGPYSYITSTGYYGGTTRTLTANIDRQSGTLYDLYDYVLFKGN